MQKKFYLNDEKPLWKKILEVTTEAALVFAFAFFCTQYVFSSVLHNSRSMEPSIMQGSTVFTNRLSYTVTSPNRYDCIAFRRNEESSDILVRRIIALPGESIRIYRGTVYINGSPMDISEYVPDIPSDGIAAETIYLGANQYFVLGDAAANSEDSRSGTLGLVHRRQIIGHSWLYATHVFDIHFIR